MPSDTAPPRTTMLIIWAGAEVLSTIAAVGRYEDSITVSTHGNPDIWPAWIIYQLLTPVGAVLLWWIAFVAAIGVFLQFVKISDWKPTRSWLAVVAAAAVFQCLTWLYLPLTMHGGGPLHETFVDRRPFAYPLWMVATVLVLAVVILTVKAMRQHRSG